MRFLNLIIPDGQDWVTWRSSVDKVLSEVVDEGGKGWQPFSSKTTRTLPAEYMPQFSLGVRNSTYKRARPFLVQLHGEKCAYCESPYDNVTHVDVEHYRPKGEVTDIDGKVVGNGKYPEHPGYYWLAYLWGNLLLSCPLCNRPPAKGTKFPLVSEKVRAYEPSDAIKDEEPFALNPYVDDPEVHINFDVIDGLLGYKTERGRVSVEDIYHLNRAGLVKARGRLVRSEIKPLARDIADARMDSDWTRLKEVVEEVKSHWEVAEPYSAVWIAKTRVLIAECEKLLAEQGL